MPEPARFTHCLASAPRAVLRQRAAADAVRAHPRDSQVLVVAPSPEAGSRVLRMAADGQGGAFGYQRLTPRELVARLGAVELARAGKAQVSSVVLEGVCARRVHELRGHGALGIYARVGERPGLPRALARAFVELGLADVPPTHPALGDDLARVYAAYRDELAQHGLADPSDALRAARARAEDPAPHPLLDHPLVLLDVPVRSALEQSLWRTLAARAPVTAVLPDADAPTLVRLAQALEVPPEPLASETTNDALHRLSTQLFAEVHESGPLDETVEVLSAPGESRECAEIARRVIAAAERGVRFDRMAVLAHAPARYRAHLVEALGRARIPAHFSRGTVRPDPSGRALLALLACREDDLSARAFAEYLSLGVVPDADDGSPPSPERDVAWRPPDTAAVPFEAELDASAEGARGADDPVVEGSLRAPWRWERLLVDAAVVGGAERWRRRLAQLRASLERRLDGYDDVDDPRREGAARRLHDLEHLASFALPLLESLDALPTQATWEEWADVLEGLARRALRDPAHTLAVLRELSPMGPIGPVGLGEVRLVLARRLTEMYSAPSGAPAGRLFVGSTDEARGLSFDLVFVPGLAERVFPRKIIGDPILLDRVRRELDAGLPTSATQVADERLALRLAVGAAEQRVVLSYPRMDAGRGRPRVPSFYALEVVRAVEGALPSFEQLATRAEAASRASMSWPAPEEPEHAIDDAEYDLAVLRELLDADKIADVEGGARYLVDANEHLGRALRRRFQRWQGKWKRQDGMVTQDETALAALAAHRPSARAYSPTALEHLAQCPYRFYLRSVLRLSPVEVPEPLESIDPLSRGTLIHAVQFALLGRLRERAWLPLTEDRLEDALALLDEVMAEQATRFAEELAPAIERVWNDAVADVRADLAEWLHQVAERPDWVPMQFELAFGLAEREGHDAASVDEPVTLAEGLTLRGSIDLVERRGEQLRATDHKTGAARAPHGVIAGGKHLQPLLYARVLEELHTDTSVLGGRLYYCTSRGRFEERLVRLDPNAREAVKLVAETLDEMIADGFLPAAPEDRACRRCDYLPVCGPAEERRVRKKNLKRLRSLTRLRKQP